jgi:hypothetical protein
LLNLVEFAPAERTIEKIEKEYNRDKYGKCLEEFHHLNDRATYEAIKQFEFGLPANRELCVSRQTRLYALTLQEARNAYYHLLVKTLARRLKAARTVVELGAGYGFNLWMLKRHFPKTEFVGGEFSRNAVQLSSLLNARLPANQRVRVARFNFYEPADYRLIGAAPSPVVVFTSHAIEQCPSAKLVVKNLLRLGSQIAAVFHFEPVPELSGDSLLGLLRRRYADLNDYNRDLLTLLRNHPSIRLDSVQANVFGHNPLNVTSIIEWKPRTNRQQPGRG